MLPQGGTPTLRARTPLRKGVLSSLRLPKSAAFAAHFQLEQIQARAKKSKVLAVPEMWLWLFFHLFSFPMSTTYYSVVIQNRYGTNTCQWTTLQDWLTVYEDELAEHPFASGLTSWLLVPFSL